MDDPQLIAPDVIMNMMITYRDVQVRTATVAQILVLILLSVVGWDNRLFSEHKFRQIVVPQLCVSDVTRLCKALTSVSS